MALPGGSSRQTVYMPRDPTRLRHLMEEYDRLCRLEGYSLRSRGQRFDRLIAELLSCWGIDAATNVRAPGQIDVAFTVGGTDFVLEAKWQHSRVNTGQISKLKTRVQQRFADTRGIFLSMSGYSRPALAEVTRGERLQILLLDKLHWEAMLGGLIPPDELLRLVRDRAAYQGMPYAPLPKLFGPAEPSASFDPPGAALPGRLDTALPGVQAETVLSARSRELGIACHGREHLFLTTDDAVVDADLRQRVVRVAVPLRGCSRNPLVLDDGTVYFARRHGIGCLRDGEISTVGGGFGGSTCLLRSPDGSVCVFDNGAPPSGASITKLGEHLGQQTRHEIDYPAANALSAAWLSTDDLLVIGQAGFRVFSLSTGEQRAQPVSQSNPRGLIQLRESVVLTSGDSVSLVRTDISTWDHREVAQLAIPSEIEPVSELSQDADGTIYLASHYRAPEPGWAFAIVRLRFPAGLI
jgi:Restriction endonuclease